MKIARMNLGGKIRTVVIKSENKCIPFEESASFYDLSEETIDGQEPLLQSFSNKDFLVPIPLRT